MTWNIRVVRDRYDNGDEFYSLREVYYDDDGNVTAMTADAGINIEGETYEDLAEYLSWCVIGLSKPVLDPAELWPDQTQRDENVQESTDSVLDALRNHAKDLPE